MKEKIVIVGGGGHAKVIIDAIVSRNKLDIAGIVDPSLPKGFKVIGVSVLGNDSLLKQIFKKGIRIS